MKTYCGADCEQCPGKDACPGCLPTEGKPLGGTCVAAECVKRGGACALAEMKRSIIDEFNALRIPGMPPVTGLTQLPGAYVNLAYPLPSGESVRLLCDERIYFTWQLEKAGSERCFGLVADEERLIVAEYGENGADPALLLYKKR